MTTTDAPRAPALGFYKLTMWECSVTESGGDGDRVTFYALTDSPAYLPNVLSAYEALRGPAGFFIESVDAVGVAVSVRRAAPGELVIGDPVADQRTCVATLDELGLTPSADYEEPL